MPFLRSSPAPFNSWKVLEVHLPWPSSVATSPTGQLWAALLTSCHCKYLRWFALPADATRRASLGCVWFGDGKYAMFSSSGSGVTSFPLWLGSTSSRRFRVPPLPALRYGRPWRRVSYVVSSARRHRLLGSHTHICFRRAAPCWSSCVTQTLMQWLNASLPA